MLSVCETMLDNVKTNLLKANRTNAELYDKLQQLFQDNIADFDKFQHWYDESKPRIDIIGKAEYEHYVIEDFKRSVYGDSYEIKPFEWCG